MEGSTNTIQNTLNEKNRGEALCLSSCVVAASAAIWYNYRENHGSKPPRFLLPFDYHWRHWLAAFCRILPFPWQSHRLLTTISARQIAVKRGRIRLFRRLIALDQNLICVPREAAAKCSILRQVSTNRGKLRSHERCLYYYSTPFERSKNLLIFKPPAKHGELR